MSAHSDFAIHCQNCGFSHMCIPVSLDKKEMASLDEIIERKRPYHKSDLLTTAGETFKCLYAIRSGSFKSFITSEDGEQQITGFHFPGDVVGFDAIKSDCYQGYTQALETSLVCEIPYDMVDQMSAYLPSLRRQMMNIMSSEIKQDHDLMMLLNRRTAEERIAHFLLNLSERFADRGFSPKEFNLTMTRNEIGNYLGLTVETVSRLFTRFQKESLVQVNGKLIEITDMQGLTTKLSANKEPKKGCQKEIINL